MQLTEIIKKTWDTSLNYAGRIGRMYIIYENDIMLSKQSTYTKDNNKLLYKSYKSNYDDPKSH